jgi:hypothetical protein
MERQLRKLKFDDYRAAQRRHGRDPVVCRDTGWRHVLEPALVEPDTSSPQLRKSIDNFEANNGIIEQGYEGILSAPPDQKPRPFEIVFETPYRAPLDKQIEAHIVAVQTILDRFKVLISEAQNI